MSGWLTWSSMQGSPRKDFGCVKINSSQILLIGGKRNFSGLRSCDIFDVKEKTWSSCRELPFEMMYCRATVVNRYVYVIGNYRDFYRMNIDNMKQGWQRLPSLKIDGLCCELVSDHRWIYRIGGNFDRTSMERYDTITNHWETLPKMHVGRDYLRAIVVNKLIYVFGGRAGDTGESPLDSVEIYDIERREWSDGPPIPKKMYAHSAAAVGNRIVVSGGEKRYGSKAFARSFILDTRKDDWYCLDYDLPQSLCGHSAVTFGIDIFLIGGSGSYSEVSETPIYMTTLDPFETSRCLDDSSHNSCGNNFTGIINFNETFNQGKSKLSFFTKQSNQSRRVRSRRMSLS